MIKDKNELGEIDRREQFVKYAYCEIVPQGNKETKTTAETEYNEHIYKGCGKSLACKDICPAGIDMDKLLSKSNAVAVWKRLMKK